MSSADVIMAGIDLVPAHTAATARDINKAYEYVDSVIDTADDDNNLLWHGWALREAFLAGMQSVNGELKPCPFCGNRDVEVLPAWDINETPEVLGDDFAVICSMNAGGCGATGGYRHKKTEALRDWNMMAVT